MTEVKFSARAFCKLILHASKYPHCSVNGVLLAKPTTNNKTVEFIDTVPLFHISINLTPMAEIALMQIDELAASKGLVIAGYYSASEYLKENSFDRAHHRIAEKISINCNPSYVVVVDNSKLYIDPDVTALKVAQLIDGNFKSIDETNVSVNQSSHTMTQVMIDLQTQRAYNLLVDFDNHLDNIELDWMNLQLNKVIEESVNEKN